MYVARSIKCIHKFITIIVPFLGVPYKKKEGKEGTRVLGQNQGKGAFRVFSVTKSFSWPS